MASRGRRAPARALESSRSLFADAPVPGHAGVVKKAGGMQLDLARAVVGRAADDMMASSPEPGGAADTTALYLDAIENAYLAFGCSYFAWSERRSSARTKKYYPVDTGLRRIAVTKTVADRGKMLECATYVVLRRRFGEVFYWRDRGEVGFVVLRGGEPVPIQVSWDAPSERHRAGVDAFHEHPRAREACFVTAEAFEQGLPELVTE